MKKRSKRLIVAVMTALLVIQCATPAYAYFQRGSVNISVGRSSVTLNQGGSESVSVSMSPSSDSQLPGCGMAECPQSCGEKECLDANGECTCNGKSYQTYYAYASVSSSNTSVATASYGGGVVSIRGVGPGTATITLTASLRQYTSTSTSIQVTVNGSTTSSSQNSGNSSVSSSGSSSKPSANKVSKKSGSVSATAINSGKSVLKDGKSGEKGIVVDEDGKVKVTKDAISSVDSDRGKIYFVPIIVGTQGKEQFEMVKDKKEYVVFQAKDEADTVLYSWKFYGKDLKKAEDMNFAIEGSTNAFEGCDYGDSSNTVYLSFAHEGELPGKASINYGVGDFFKEDESLNLYLYDEENGEATLVQDDVSCENGYVTMTLEHCSKYILTSEDIKDAVVEDNAHGSSYGVILVIVLSAIAAAIIYVVMNKIGSRKVKARND